MSFCLLAFLQVGTIHAQEFGLSFGYQYLLSDEWDAGIRGYNEAHPELEDQHTIFRHGYILGLDYLPWRVKPFSFGVFGNYSAFSTIANNPDMRVRILNRVVDVGLRFKFRPLYAKFKKHGPIIEFNPSFTGGTIHRMDNWEIHYIPVGAETLKARSWSYGVGLNGRLGYEFTIVKEINMTFYVGASYDPWVWNTRSRLVLNDTATGDLGELTKLIRIQAGIQFTELLVKHFDFE